MVSIGGPKAARSLLALQMFRPTLLERGSANRKEVVHLKLKLHMTCPRKSPPP